MVLKERYEIMSLLIFLQCEILSHCFLIGKKMGFLPMTVAIIPCTYTI